MTDREIIKGLIDRDNLVTKEFFFEKCRPLFCFIINLIFSYEVDYDEFVNELYVYLMENDAQKLRDFQYRCSLYTWLKILAIRYFIKMRARMIDDKSQETPYEVNSLKTGSGSETSAEADLDRLLKAMPQKRYELVIRRLVLEDRDVELFAQEMNITTANLYNIKRRAIAQLIRVALNDIKAYGK